MRKLKKSGNEIAAYGLQISSHLTKKEFLKLKKVILSSVDVKTARSIIKDIEKSIIWVESKTIFYAYKGKRRVKCKRGEIKELKKLGYQIRKFRFYRDRWTGRFISKRKFEKRIKNEVKKIVGKILKDYGIDSQDFIRFCQQQGISPSLIIDMYNYSAKRFNKLVIMFQSSKKSKKGKKDKK